MFFFLRLLILVINGNGTPSSSPLMDEVRTNISSSIGPAASTPSTRHSKPVSLTSTDTFFKNFQPQFNGNLSDDHETAVEETYLWRKKMFHCLSVAFSTLWRKTKNKSLFILAVSFFYPNRLKDVCAVENQKHIDREWLEKNFYQSL